MGSLDDETRARNLAHVRAIKAQLGHPARPEDASTPSAGVSAAAIERRSVFDDPAAMAAEMANAAHRELLEARIAELSAENARLRAVLANVLQLVGRGIAGAVDNDATAG